MTQLTKVETEKYKDYIIEVYEQEPNVEPLNENDWDDLDDGGDMLEDLKQIAGFDEIQF